MQHVKNTKTSSIPQDVNGILLVQVVEAMEAELKTMEKNVPKIRTILSSMDDSNITLTEHLHNRQVQREGKQRL